ncbi:Uncharacterised protein [Sphingobacterium multivorum]|uniref:hypothetical protein n=1 Tax=Sphingobacterium multivorum TaxID=28454 RepID=UPI000DFBDE72|nr:hypothetical protein [Sphingobacterium multivorum]QQT43320.1 hypothetical protein I6J00_16370 [Sphingobacterium multivorum]QQT44927.1 hypothetical protein I6J00_25060 [Sphingobacterium multivorum]SUI98716.1 Uncharacterised protein [Sphingobacterium multivorum]SUJ18458.1 Uncharacterised protein [Sphingobacterium multivorum]
MNNWIKIGTPESNEILAKKGVKILLAFDNGDILDLEDDNYPFAEITHVMEVENPNKKH